MYTPVFRGTPTQRTEIRVAYDDEYFYVGGWFYDTDPSGIRINSLYRDRWNGDDALAIYIDAFNDNQNAKWFGTTPAGMRFDLLVSDDGNTTNDNWDTFWTSRDDGHRRRLVRRSADSVLEPRLPGRRRRPRVMGLTVTRLVSRLDERVTFPAIDPKFPFRRPSVAQDVVLRGVRSQTPLYVTPYVLGGGSRDIGPRAPARRSARERDTAGRSASTSRYPLSRQADARPHRQHRLRAGRGRRPAGRARSLPAVLPGAAPLLPGRQQPLRLRRRRRHAAVPLAPHRPDAGLHAGARSSAARASSARVGRVGRRRARDADRRARQRRRARTSACCGCGVRCSTRTRPPG